MYFDYTTISFPFLGLEIDPQRFIQIGEFKIYFYGIIIAVGLLLALTYALKRINQFGIKEDDLIDGVLWVVPFAIVCARLYYCVFKWRDFADDPISIFYINKGGLAIYGGVIGALIGVLVHCKIKKIKVGALLDLVALGFLIGQAVGRWGNFFNREAFGAETDFFLKMGLLNTATGKVEYHHPTFLYESLWNVVGFVMLHVLSKRRKYDGQIALGYVAWYGLGRTMIEGLRTDSLYWGPFRVSQVLAAVSCFAAVVVLMLMTFKTHDPENLFVNQVAAANAVPEEEEEEEEPQQLPESPHEEPTLEADGEPTQEPEADSEE